MKEINIDLGKDIDSFNILPLGDFHIGDEFCDLTSLQKTIEYIADSPNTFTVLNGDMINNAIKTSVSDTYREKMTVEQQQDYLIKLLTPIKDKILYMTQGNHEYRTSSLASVDPTRYVAKALGLLDAGKYSDNSYVITLRYGSYKSNNSRNKYVIYGIHGSGTGGKRMGATVNALEDMTKIVPNANLYIHSHTHVPITYSDVCYMHVCNHIESFERTFVNTNGFIKYGGYAERFGYKPVNLSPLLVNVKTQRIKNKVRPISTVIKLS